MSTEELIEKQKLIREGLVRFCECEYMGDSEECPNCEFGLAFVDRIFAFLTEKGAVLSTPGKSNANGWLCNDCTAKGFTATAPLMEKK